MPYWLKRYIVFTDGGAPLDNGVLGKVFRTSPADWTFSPLKILNIKKLIGKNFYDCDCHNEDCTDCVQKSGSFLSVAASTILPIKWNKRKAGKNY